MTTAKAPQPDETLDNYIRRLRNGMKLSQQQVATAAGIHLQSLGKLERGKTNRLNQKTKKGLAVALSIPEEYLDAVCSGLPVEEVHKKQFCPACWIPGTPPDPAWTLPRAKHCLFCGRQLSDDCHNCHAPIASFAHKFCPNCGTAYADKGGGLAG
ncbi:helix-turn-helix domain-containing protein [Floridanema evergladense]|uniref:Helix-turn-helix domain-containing protein n=1 Tax=Floridaenema evergladense BLCC-F167 TaxID=3153639 RepID=A0ABV4WNG5_9CYAN